MVRASGTGTTVSVVTVSCRPMLPGSGGQASGWLAGWLAESFVMADETVEWPWWSIRCSGS